MYVCTYIFLYAILTTITFGLSEAYLSYLIHNKTDRIFGKRDEYTHNVNDFNSINSIKLIKSESKTNFKSLNK